MQLRMAFFLSLLTFQVSANNIIVNGTRFIFPGNEKEITVQLTNTAKRPAVVQVWLDKGDTKEIPGNITTPFMITPPISRVDGDSGQTLRIRLHNRASLLNDREQLWWLNVLEIPPTQTHTPSSENNVLQLAIRSRFKFIYRPVGLGDRDAAPQQLVLSLSGNALAINNPTPFFITITRVYLANKQPLLTRTVVVSPRSTTHVATLATVKSGEDVLVNNVNDYGANITVTSRIN